MLKHCLAVLICTSIASVAFSQTTVLYDGSAGAGNQTPQSQGWLEYTALLGTPVISSTGGSTSFDTTAASTTEAGYSNYNVFPSIALVNPSFPSLDPTTGFTVDLKAQITSESHSNANRAGFSLIALGSDKKGIELAFWTPAASTNNIWVQSTPPFTQAEGTIFDDASASHDYQLTIQGGTYILKADGTQILTGATRDYSSAAIPPYTLTNYLFIGDDTTSAAGAENFSYLSVSVPEPISGALLLGLVGMLGMTRVRRNARA